LIIVELTGGAAHGVMLLDVLYRYMGIQDSIIVVGWPVPEVNQRCQSYGIKHVFTKVGISPIEVVDAALELLKLPNPRHRSADVPWRIISTEPPKSEAA
jgi:hypothetical protein